MRAILQAVSLPSRSVKKNMEAAEKQFKSEYFLPFLGSKSQLSPCQNYILHTYIGLKLSTDRSSTDPVQATHINLVLFKTSTGVLFFVIWTPLELQFHISLILTDQLLLGVIFPISATVYEPLSLWFPIYHLADRKPGDIEGITDIFFEDFKNFPQVRELGEESARFVREEMEKTWGDSRMAVLAEDEAQRWILGVTIICSCSVLTVTYDPIQ